MLHGRGDEQTAVERLLDSARDGDSGALVIRGEPGAGKSALLRHAAERAGDLRTLRGAGVESEAELPFAALHLLLRGELGRLDALPQAQAEALRGALGLGALAPENRFLVGLAVLSLLAEIAGDGSLLCVVDDAQWVDQASLDALVFAARRLDAEGIALIFATRDAAEPAGLPELVLRGVDRAAATALLPADLAPAVRERILDEADGNPLALLELPAVLTPEQRAGRLAPYTKIPVTSRVRQAFLGQITALPEAAQLVLAVLAADDTGSLGVVLRACEEFGAGIEDLESARRARLVEVAGQEVSFRHPLIRPTAYQNVPLTTAPAVHRALAGALDGREHADRRAWHLAAATAAPDEDVAAELVRVAERAQTRAGYAAMAAAYERAAELTPDPDLRSVRLAAAAVAASDGGRFEHADRLADRASGIGDPLALAHLLQVRAHVHVQQGAYAEAARVIVAGAGRIAQLDPERAAYLYLEAIRCAWFGTAAEPALRAAALMPPVDVPLVGGALGVAAMMGGEVPKAVALMDRLLVDPDISGLGIPGRLFLAQVALAAGRPSLADEVAARAVADCRARGMDGWLIVGLNARMQALACLGRYQDMIEAREDGTPLVGDPALLDGPLAFAHAELGDEERGRSGGGAVGAWALGRLELALGRPEAALKAMEPVAGAAYAPFSLFMLPDRVEAALRVRDTATAEMLAGRYTEWAQAVGLPSALAVAARCAALVADDEERFALAVQLHEGGEQPQEEARTRLLYGEWLRRARRRAEARTQLRGALADFDGLGMSLWAERARAELRLTGDVPAAPRRADDPLSVLTAQERQVVRLAATGASNRDIAAQLYLSPRTVGYHLYKAYPKLGIAARSELAALVG
ncbi:AAA family ATPase [Nonomuraea sp. NPDC059007]|uniref:AAA family ATPase n=1 Tax=Nonomuraea sp. NPDC059007 TaxID=3346692 RepID=UPI0036CF7CCA